jgi:hypothetical protein
MITTSTLEAASALVASATWVAPSAGVESAPARVETTAYAVTIHHWIPPLEQRFASVNPTPGKP